MDEVKISIVLYEELRKLGVELYDDAGNRIRPNSPEEARVLDSLAAAVCQSVVQGSPT